MSDDYVTWSARLVGDDGMEIRRDYSQDAQGFVTSEDSASVNARIEVSSDGTYNLVDSQGRILARVPAFPGGGSGYTISVGEARLTQGEPTFTTATVTFDSNTVLMMLPDGDTVSVVGPMKCPCPLCQTARGETMDRDQVARVAADIGSSLMPDNSQWMNRFTVESTSSSRVYTVAQRRSDNVWGCSCPSWINRRHCKHLTDILKRLAKLSEFDVTDPAVLEMLRSARTAYLDLDASTAFPVTKVPTYRRHIDL